MLMIVMRQIAAVALVLTVGGCASTVAPQGNDSAAPTGEMISTRLGPTLSVTEVDCAKKVLRRVEPLYPDLARRNHVRGLVKMSTLISVSGEVVDVEVLEGLPDGLSDAAVHSVRQWKFAPTVRDGAPVPVQCVASINFRLN
jgi:protein TonB